jgi:hypothetical protein
MEMVNRWRVCMTVFLLTAQLAYAAPPPGPLPPTPPELVPLGAFTASARYDSDLELMVSEWTEALGADYYALSLRYQQGGRFFRISQTFDPAERHLLFENPNLENDWGALTARVEACNADGCTAAPDIALAPRFATVFLEKQKVHQLMRPDERGRFGAAMALSRDGSTLAIGAPNADAVDATNGGQVHIFVLNLDRRWELQASLQAAPGTAEPGEEFGGAVALSNDGNTLAVGDAQDNGPSNNPALVGSGAVTVFERVGTTWTRKRVLRDTQLIANAHYGASIALSGDGRKLVVGAPDKTIAGVARVGAVNVWTRADGWGSDQPAPTRVVVSLPNDSAAPVNEARFGATVAITSGASTLVVATPGRLLSIGGANVRTGAVYVYSAWTNSWVLESRLNPSRPMGYATAIAMSSSAAVLAVGAPEDSGPLQGTEAEGSVYLYTRSNSNPDWLTTLLKAPTTYQYARFGSSVSVSVSANALAVGAPFDSSDADFAGAVYLFSAASPDVWIPQPVKLTPSQASTSNHFGGRVLIDDPSVVIVSDDRDNELGTADGAVYMHGSRPGSD